MILPKAEIQSREAVSAAVSPAKTGKVSSAIVTVVSTNEVIYKKPVWMRDWTGEASVGLDYENGAKDHRLYYVRGKVTYARPYASDTNEFFRNILIYDDNYGKSAGTVSDDRMLGSCKTDADLSEKTYLYNFGAAGYDNVRMIDLHFEDGPGGGYHWIKKPDLSVNLELGASYFVDEHSDNTKTENFFYRVGQNLTKKINDHVKFTEKFEYLPQYGYIDQYQLRTESTLACSLFWNLALNLTLADLYDTKPAAQVPNNDFQLRSSLSVKF